MELLVVIVVTVAAVAAVLYPLLRGDARDVPIEAEQDEARDADVEEEEVARYRAALRARTLCRRCGRANPEGSAFCAECGRRLEAGRNPSRAPSSRLPHAEGRSGR